MNAYIFSKSRPTNPLIVNGDVYTRTDTVTPAAVVVAFTYADGADGDVYAPAGADFEVLYGPCDTANELPPLNLAETFDVFDVTGTDGKWYQVRRLGW